MCDPCLLEADHPLGMVLALVAITGTFAASDIRTDRDFYQVVNELGAFARIYHRFASHFGPVRAFLAESPPKELAEG